MNHETSLATVEYARRCLREYFEYQSQATDLSGAILETALYLEDVLGIELTDHELNADCLGTDEAITALVLRKIGTDS